MTCDLVISVFRIMMGMKITLWLIILNTRAVFESCPMDCA